MPPSKEDYQLLRKLAAFLIVIVLLAFLVGGMFLAAYAFVNHHPNLFRFTCVVLLLVYFILGFLVHSISVSGMAYSWIGWKRHQIVHLPMVGESVWTRLSVDGTNLRMVGQVWVSPEGIRAFILMLGDVSIRRSEIYTVYLTQNWFTQTCLISHHAPGMVSPIYTTVAVYELIGRVMPELLNRGWPSPDLFDEVS